ncbi:MAG: LPXTG cell wall anchor domain-containing protein [Vicinamibacteria bacterium]|jgi:LPXTG-motif cell wall-anchored protein
MRAVRSLTVSVAATIAALAMGASAAAAGGPAIPGGAFGGHGVTGPAGLPSSDYRYVTFSLGDRTIVERIATDSGIVTRTHYFDGLWALPAVTILGNASGLSADGRTLVLIKPDYRLRSQETTLRILDAATLRRIDRVQLDSRASFDAISPDGSLLYLVQYADPRDPLDYRVRAYDWSANEFRPGKIVDPEEPDEQMSGQPVARRTSPDGRWAYTLYSGGEETFIHALDTEGATAVCVDLPGIDREDLYMLRLDVDPASGQITVLDQGSPVAIVDPQTFSVSDPPPVAVSDDVAEPDAGSWVGWAAIGGGAVLVAGLGLVLWRRRRPGDGVDERTLERLVRIDAGEREQAEREPVR